MPDALAQDLSGRSGALLHIDLGALAANWRGLRDLAGTAECAAAVKGDGYGLGLEQVGAALHAAGARTFFVAHDSEGRRLRAILPHATIYVLNGLPPGAAAAFVAARLRPVLGSRPELEEWSAQGGAHPAAVHVDTGMNRLGMLLSEALDGFFGVRPSLLISHLACADEPGHPLTLRQRDAMRTLKAAYPDIPASLANSAATLGGSDLHFDMVRPGIALYGAEALRGRIGPMRPVATLTAPVIQIRDVPAGGTIGYGADFTAPRPMRVAVLSLGYADGYPRAAGGTRSNPGACVAFAGRRARIVGRVSMDLITIDATDLPGLERGDHVEAFGPALPIDETARRAGTIGYEILTGLGSRLRRVYVGGS